MSSTFNSYLIYPVNTISFLSSYAYSYFSSRWSKSIYHHKVSAVMLHLSILIWIILLKNVSICVLLHLIVIVGRIVIFVTYCYWFASLWNS